MRNTAGSESESRSSNMESPAFIDLGHPLLDRIAHSFLTAAGIGAVQAVSCEACSTVVEDNACQLGAVIDSGGSTDAITNATNAKRRHSFPGLRGETNRNSIEALVKRTGKESMQWGLAAGMYSGVTYGLKEACGYHDWKNSAVAGALTGVTLALTSDATTHEQVVQSALTGAAIATAANLLSGFL